MKYAMSPPPGASGTEMQQLAKMRSWLYQMNEQLNIALSNLDAGNFAQGTAQAIQEVADGELTATVREVREDGNRIVEFSYEGIFLEVLEPSI